MIYKIFPAIALVLLSVTSCKKELEEQPFSSLSSTTVFADEAGLKNATLGVYQSWTAMPFFDVFFRFVLAESGHRYATAGLFDAAFFDPYYKFGHTPTDGGTLAVWRRYFATIARANTVIDNAGKAVSDTNIAKVYIAEARFNRAYAYFNLVRDFGGVPIIKNEIKSLEQTSEIFGARATVEETYNFIVEDLKFAEKSLPDKWTGNNLGRISAGASKALLGKVYLTMAGKPLSKMENYQKAVDKLNEVIIPSGEVKYNFGLENNFVSVFAINNKRNKEVVFSYSYFYSSASPNASLYPYFLFPPGLVDGDEQTRYGFTYDFYKLFENSDTRRDFTAVERYKFSGTFPNGSANFGDSIIFDPISRHYVNKVNGKILGNSNVKCGIAFGKFDRVPRPAGAIPWGYSTDLIELRYSDVLLCLAEALNETGRSGEAISLLNRVRNRAQASSYSVSSQNIVRDQIRKERRLELSGEFTTVYDIRRWGTLQNEIASMSPSQIVDNNLNPYSPKLELYPIPQTQLDANPKLIQNKDW